MPFNIRKKNESAKPDPRCSEYIHAALLNSKLAPQPKHDNTKSMKNGSTARFKLEQHIPAYVHNSKPLQTLAHARVHNLGTFPMLSSIAFLLTRNTKEIKYYMWNQSFLFSL